MYKRIFLFFCCVTFIFACENKPVRAKDVLAKLHHSTRVDTSAGSSSEPPDSSLISLKTFQRVALTDILSQVWKLEDADKTHWDEIFWDSAKNTRQFPELALFPDHMMTENPRCALRMGKWVLNKDTRELVIRFDGGGQKTYLVQQIALKQMELEWKKEEGSPATIKLSAAGISHKRPEEDPFYPANNRWRIKPVKPESDKQIRERIKGFIHFFSLFFLDNHYRREADISFSGLPCCLVWYNGGIGMQQKLDLDKRWIDCFYSEDQAYTAYDMVAAELGKHELKWPEHPTSWIRQEGEVLGQLAAKF